MTPGMVRINLIFRHYFEKGSLFMTSIVPYPTKREHWSEINMLFTKSVGLSHKKSRNNIVTIPHTYTTKRIPSKTKQIPEAGIWRH